MMNKILLTLLMLTSVSHAAIQDIASRLNSSDLDIQTQARSELLSACSDAGRPGAEAERETVCKEICAILHKGCPVPVAIPLVRNLQRIGGDESVATLTALLSSRDEHLRDDARQALAVNPSPAAGEALRKELAKSRDDRWTAGLLVALGERKVANTAGQIAPYLKKPNPQIFAAAAKSLSQIGETDGIQALIKARNSESGYRKSVLTAALLEADFVPAFRLLCDKKEPDDVRATALLALISKTGSTEFAEEAMASGAAALQVAVIEAAAQQRNPDLYTILAGQLNSLPSHLQLRAVTALEHSENSDYAPSMEALMESPDEECRNAAIRALARIGTADSIPALLAVNSDEANRALGMLVADGVDQILETEAKTAGDPARRARAINALALRGRSDLMPTYLTYAAEADNPVAEAGIDAIVKFGDSSNLDPLIALMIDKDTMSHTRDLLRAIVEIMRASPDQEKCVDILVARMDGASPRTQASLFRALAQVASPEALQPVLAGCKSSDEELCKQSIKLLGAWKSDNALSAMLNLADDDSLPLADHVQLVRGATRLLAAQDDKNRQEDTVILAMKICRRTEEREALIPLLSKARTEEGKAAFEAALNNPELSGAARSAQAE